MCICLVIDSPCRHINRPGDRICLDASGPGAHLPDPPSGRVLPLQALLILVRSLMMLMGVVGFLAMHHA
jgi:hypothetical protein